MKLARTVRKLRLVVSFLMFALMASNAWAEPPAASCAFREAGLGLYEFDTGLLRGRLKLDGEYQGLYPLVDAVTGAELVRPPGVFSFYRVLGSNKRFGKNARDWPTTSRLLADGAVEASWAPAQDHPLEITGVHRWSAPDTLDLEITVKPQQDMPRFELFMSSYLGQPFMASIYLKPDGESGVQPRFVPVDRESFEAAGREELALQPPPGTRAAKGYVMFPRDADALKMIRDGRWFIGSNPVAWSIERWLAAALFLRRDAAGGLTAVMMAPPGDCFAISSPWNPPTVDAGGYRSIYLSLYGRDLRAGETARASCRFVLARDLSNDEAVRRYEDYLEPIPGSHQRGRNERIGRYDNLRSRNLLSNPE